MHEPGRLHRALHPAREHLRRAALPSRFHLLCDHVQHDDYDRVLHFDVAFQGYNNNLSPHSRGGLFRPQLAWDVTVGDHAEVGAR